MALLTEQQAKSKWCPLARAESTRGSNAIPVNRSGNAPDVDCLCIASGCMAWRSEAVTLDREGHSPERVLGYCGAFGPAKFAESV